MRQLVFGHRESDNEFGAIGSSVLKSPNGQVLAKAAASGNIFVVGSGHEFFNGFLGGRGEDAHGGRSLANAHRSCEIDWNSVYICSRLFFALGSNMGNDNKTLGLVHDRILIVAYSNPYRTGLYNPLQQRTPRWAVLADRSKWSYNRAPITVGFFFTPGKTHLFSASCTRGYPCHSTYITSHISAFRAALNGNESWTMSQRSDILKYPGPSSWP